MALMWMASWPISSGKPTVFGEIPAWARKRTCYPRDEV
jgi:hypothetical protein